MEVIYVNECKKLLELTNNVPRMNVPGASVTERTDCHGYPFYIIRGTTKVDFINYLESLKACGFSMCMETGIIGGSRMRNATYRRGEVFVSIMHGRTTTLISHHLYPHYIEVNVDQLFSKIPKLKGYGSVSHKPVKTGNGTCQMIIERTLKEHYLRYLEELETAGFTKFSDNGDGIDGNVFNNIFVKNNLVVSVIYLKKTNVTYILAAENQPLSEHLHIKQEYIENNREGANTKLHMLEMWGFGNSFVFQLKNGHFIVSDGGLQSETNYFLDYIENLVPKGEKPVIEAWFLSHPHPDHTGVMQKIGRTPELAQRIYVEGIYYNEPSDCVLNTHLECSRQDSELTWKAIDGLWTTKGEHPKIYRTLTGQRYYFCDITVDVLLGQDQLPLEKYYREDVNESSTWLVINIEGQKCLFGGDGHTGGMSFMMHNYSKKYFEMDIVTSLHHSGNSRNYFTDFCSIKTLLVTRGTEPTRRIEENKYLRDSVEEWFSRAEGTRVLTFPYVIGSSEILPHFDWKYHQGLEKPNY